MSATESPSTLDASVVLTRESRTRQWAGIAALVAGVLGVVAGVAPSIIYKHFPHVYLVDALRDAAGQDIHRAGLKTAEILFYNDKAVPLLLVAIAQALAALSVGILLLFLLHAATARGASTPRFTRYLVQFGAGASAFGALMLQIGVMIRSHDFASSADHSTHAAHEVLRSGVVVAASGIGGVGSVALAAGFVMVALGAMRVGLLTRFLGVLGAIVGVLIVLGPLSGSPSFIVQSFWLLLAGVLVLGRWPRGMPPAWTTGESVPWPSQQELREQRVQTRGGGGGSAPLEDAPAPVRDPGAARKKRKRRS